MPEKKKRVLCISYDESLLTTRKMMLEQAGFDVVAAFGFAEATTICRLDHNFDVIVRGHSIPRKEKKVLLETPQPDCGPPLVTVRRHNEPPLTKAFFSIAPPDPPQELVRAVQS